MTVERLKSAWAGRLRAVPESFDGTGLTMVQHPGGDAVITVVLGQACVVATPPSLSVLLSAAAPAVLCDAGRLAALIDESGLDGRWTPIGTADLWTTSHPPAPGSHPVRASADGDLADVRGRVSEQEWDESGLEHLSHRWTALVDGVPGALAGYEKWPAGLAQLGVATAMNCRGRGAGASAAAAAVRIALACDLAPQWRSARGNRASAALAAGLGFVRVGQQSAVVRGVR